jgi:ATP-binding cassette, subfamily B, multidrug efflux pump
MTTSDDDVDRPSDAEAAANRTEEVLRQFHEESAIGKAYDLALMRRLLPFFKPYKSLAVIALVAVVLSAAGSLARPLIMLRTIDKGVLVGNGTVLLYGGLSVAGVVIVEQLLNFVQIYTIQILGARAVADLRRDVFDFLHRLRVGYFDRQPVGRLVTRVTNDSDAILELFASGALIAVGDMVRLVGIVILMLALDWRLSLITYAVTPLALVLVLSLRGRMREAYREIRAKTARMNSTMNEQVAGMAVVQAFQREEQAGDEFDAINRAYRDANLASIKFEAMQDAAIEMLTAVCLASIVVALGYHRATFGTVVAFNAYVVQFFEPISALAMRYTLLQSAMAGAERIFGLLDTPSSEADATARPDALPRGDADCAIELEHVTFEYKKDVPVLRDVTFRARRGEKIALVGPTGAGKSTITQLLLRLYDVQQGVVRIDGDDVTGLDRLTLRNRFSVVPQDVYLFPGTVLTNIAAGEEPDPARARQALERLGALDLFERREAGLDAPVQEHGMNFSAGERQLIAFARALYRDAPILILDEATANIDSDTEARLQRALEELLRDRTAVIIAHRLSTIRKADRIVVFHKGRVVEQGSHDELLELGGLYAKLHELQFARGEKSAAE